MRTLSILLVATVLLSLAGCYSSSEFVGANDQATPAAVPQTSSPNNAVVAAPSAPANGPATPDATTGSAAGMAPSSTEPTPAAQPPR